jgi:hypothetical protein
MSEEEESAPILPPYAPLPEAARTALFRCACSGHGSEPFAAYRMEYHLKESCLVGQPGGVYAVINDGAHHALAEYVLTLPPGEIHYSSVRSYLK